MGNVYRLGSGFYCLRMLHDWRGKKVIKKNYSRYGNEYVMGRKIQKS